MFLVNGNIFLVNGNMFLVNGKLFLVNGNLFLVNGNLFLVNGKPFINKSHIHRYIYMYLADFSNMLDVFLKQLQLEITYQMLKHITITIK